MSAKGRSTTPGITAVVVNYDGAHYLAACLDGLLAGEVVPDEVIVVDNGSTDGSQDLVRERYPDAVLLELPGNPGPAAARNLGMRVARCGRVLTLDNDVVLAPEALGRLAAALDADAGLVAVQARSVVASDPGTVHYDGGWAHYAGLLVLRNFFVPLAEAEGSGVSEVGAFVSLCVLQENARVLAAGGYDEDLEILFEDADLSFRLRALGERLAVVDDAICLHGSGTAGTSFRRDAYPARRVFLHSRNRWLFLLKNHRAWTLVLSAPALVVYEIYWLAFATLRGGLLAYLRGKWALLRLLPRVLARRHRIQSSRRVGDRELLRGGPLTLSPQLREKRIARALTAVLDTGLRGWWALVRPLVR